MPEHHTILPFASGIEPARRWVRSSRHHALQEAGFVATALLMLGLLGLGWRYVDWQQSFRAETQRNLQALGILGEMAITLGQLHNTALVFPTAPRDVRHRILAVDARYRQGLDRQLRNYAQLGSYHERQLTGLRAAWDRYQAARGAYFTHVMAGASQPSLQETHTLLPYRNAVWTSLDQLMRDEREREAARMKEYRRSENRFQALGIAGAAVLLAVMVATYWISLRMHRYLSTLQHNHNKLIERNHQQAIFTALGCFLQTVGTVDEAAKRLPRYLQALFAPHASAVYLMSPSTSHLERIAHWGEAEMEAPNCLGRQPGSLPVVEGGPAGQDAQATSTKHCAAYFCVPLIAQDAHLGALQVGVDQEPASTAPKSLIKLATHVADQLAWALANLRLREKLRDQSVRDSLTGLHNRRFLEESLVKEFARAAREKFSLAIFMLDVDHFKRFNDTYGHEAGDLVLRELGRTLKASIRGGELVCRFGGEEFTIILTHIDSASAQAWAQRLLERVRALVVKSGETTLPKVTISMGLAMYPLHGTDPDTLLQAADLALYDAKHAGRDRLAVYEE